jgi:hypothetical protein
LLQRMKIRNGIKLKQGIFHIQILPYRTKFKERRRRTRTHCKETKEINTSAMATGRKPH